MRDPEELLASALKVIDAAFASPIPLKRGKKTVEVLADQMAAMFSGGHDSTCAVHVAAQHPRFAGVVEHIDTGIGSQRTREHVANVCREMGWELRVWKSPATYEKFVTKIGFPGPGGHTWVYAWLKDRCVSQITKGHRTAYITGCRSQESVRRMGHVEPVKVGEWATDGKTGEKKRVRLNRVWVAPCHDWSSEEQAAYMEHFDLPKNPVKLALGMSGECFCGAFASPGEFERIKQHCPDVAAEIERLTKLAEAAGTPCRWGRRPDGKKGVVATQSGALCSTCDLRAAAAGIVFADACSTTHNAT